MHTQFIEITIDDEMVNTAEKHAMERTKKIVRQFIPKNAPSSREEGNYYGVIGELSVKKLLGQPTTINDNYDENKVDSGDVFYKIIDSK